MRGAGAGVQPGKAQKESVVNRKRLLTGKSFIKLHLGTIQFGRNLL